MSDDKPKQIIIDDSNIDATRKAMLRELDSMEKADPASNAAATVEMTRNKMRELRPTMEPAEGSVLDSVITDTVLVAGLALGAIALAGSAPLIALAVGAGAVSLAIDIIEHRWTGDSTSSQGVLRRPGSLIKAAVAGAAVALAPVATVSGLMVATAAVVVSETLIADEPDAEGSLINKDILTKVSKTLGVDLKGIGLFSIIAIVAVALLVACRTIKVPRNLSGVNSKISAYSQLKSEFKGLRTKINSSNKLKNFLV